MAVGLLGDALAARAGTPYEELLAERVLRPLGMEVTGTAPGSPARLLTGHSRRGRPRPPIQDFMPAAGSLRSSARDMLRFLGACLDPPATPLGRALELARQPHARVGRRFELGLCWLISKRPRGEHELIWHNGGTWGFRSYAAFAPGSGAAAIVMCNSAVSVDRIGFRLMRLLSVTAVAGEGGAPDLAAER
jgi:CubicO group peptidase (beta-lactamase class C family)